MAEAWVTAPADPFKPGETRVTKPVHPGEALFKGEKPFPIIPSCEHFAGTEKLMLKAFRLQHDLGPIFDVTCDCEDGAAGGQERAHAELVVRLQNSAANQYRMAGVRIHDHGHPAWRQDVDVLVDGAGDVTAYITLPKPTGVTQVAEMIEYIQARTARSGLKREIRVHVLIETRGALRDVQKIAALPWVQTLDFGLMDFVSGHHGAIPASAMRSPGQFEHHLISCARKPRLSPPPWAMDWSLHTTYRWTSRIHTTPTRKRGGRGTSSDF